MRMHKYSKDSRPSDSTLEELCNVAKHIREIARAERVFMRDGIIGIIEHPRNLRGFVRTDQFYDELHKRVFAGFSFRGNEEWILALAGCFPHASFSYYGLESVISNDNRHNVLQDLLTVDLMVKDARGDGLHTEEAIRVAEAIWTALPSSAEGCRACGANGYYCSCI